MPADLPSPGATLGIYLESTGDDSLTNFQYNNTGGSAKGTYLVPYSPGDLQYIIQDVLGYTATSVASPNDVTNLTRCRLRRTLPTTHPNCPYLYAYNINSFVGKGSGTAQQQVPVPPPYINIGTKPIANYFRYRQYEIGVDFASRPYPLVTDAVIDNDLTVSWYPKNAGLTVSSTPVEWKYSPEWLRYATYDYFPQDNQIQGQTGSMNLIISAARQIPFTSPPWMYLPDQILKIKWYQVPYRYITSNNSYIAPGPTRNWRGRVNQNTWWNWGAGSLLYLGFNVTRYCPPTMGTSFYPTFNGTVNRVTGVVDKSLLRQLQIYEQLCDIELLFLHTNRFMDGALPGPVSTLPNAIPAGHNLLPNLADGKFYYATRDQPTASAVQDRFPAWFSFPAEMLFTDPDADQTALTPGADN